MANTDLTFLADDGDFYRYDGKRVTRLRAKRIVAILETMWDWRGMTSDAGYTEAPRFFSINPQNHSGRRLYKLVGPNATLLVTNACRQLATSAQGHGKPDPDWLRENLEDLSRGDGFDLLLVCGKVAQAAFKVCGFKSRARVVEMPHPAARRWTKALIAEMTERIQHG